MTRPGSGQPADGDKTGLDTEEHSNKQSAVKKSLQTTSTAQGINITINMTAYSYLIKYMHHHNVLLQSWERRFQTLFIAILVSELYVSGHFCQMNNSPPYWELVDDNSFMDGSSQTMGCFT